MKIRAFITHKQSEHYADCQDRFAVGSDTNSVAVSDGMGSTWQQKIWAELLVERYIKGNDDWKPSVDTIKPLCKDWRLRVEDSIQQLKNENAPINIINRNERCLIEGRSAGATFVGIRFSKSQWNGIVLGDSCLIEWDGANAIFYTSQSTESFDNYPDYFDSDETKSGKGIPMPIQGELTEKKLLLLVSDPFSNFLLQKSKVGTIKEYISDILAVETHDNFETLVMDWRSEGMPNDDSTIIIIEYDKEEDFNIIQEDSITELINKERETSIAENIQEEAIDINPYHDDTATNWNNDRNQTIRDLFLSVLTRKDRKNRGLKNRIERIVDEGIDKLLEYYSITKK